MSLNNQASAVGLLTFLAHANTASLATVVVVALICGLFVSEKLGTIGNEKVNIESPCSVPHAGLDHWLIIEADKSVKAAEHIHRLGQKEISLLDVFGGRSPYHPRWLRQG